MIANLLEKIKSLLSLKTEPPLLMTVTISSILELSNRQIDLMVKKFTSVARIQKYFYSKNPSYSFNYIDGPLHSYHLQVTVLMYEYDFVELYKRAEYAAEYMSRRYDCLFKCKFQKPPTKTGKTKIIAHRVPRLAFLGLGLILLVSGCAIPDFYTKPDSLQQEIYNDEIQKEVAIKEVKIKNPIIEDNLNIDALSQEILVELKRPIPLDEFLSAVFYQSNLNISSIFNITPLSTQQTSTQAINIPHYKGRISDLLKGIMETHGIFFRYTNNTLIATSKESFSIHVDNYSGISKILESTLSTLGAEQVTYDHLSSKIFFVSNYKTYKKIREYLQNLSGNLAVITLHLIVGEVELENSFNRGIDWENLSMAYLSPKSPLLSGDSATVSGVKIGDRSLGIIMQTGITNITLSGANFGINSFISLLEKYGKFYTLQNTYITLQNGSRGKIDASRKNPYVKEIGIGVIGTGTATQTTQIVEFADADSGVIIELAPIYNSSTGLLSIDIDSRIQNVTEYISLSTGQITVARPVMTVRNIKTQITMHPNAVAILGGLISESETSSTSGLPGLSNTAVGGVRKENKKNSELVMVIKPLVTKFVFDNKE